MKSTQRTSTWKWFQLILSVALGSLGLWAITRDVEYSRVGQSFQTIQWEYVMLALGAIVLTILSKAWRWYTLLAPSRAIIPRRSIVTGIVLGQFFNQLLPIARSGDIVRLLALPPAVPKGQILGTLVLEKTLDTLILGITFFLLLPFIILPDIISNPSTLLATVSAVLGIMYLMAFKSSWIIRITGRVTAFLPQHIQKWIVRLVTAGLAGLDTLKNGRMAALLLFQSIWIGFLSILTPYFMFKAFDLPLGMAAAAAVNLTVLIGSIPSSAPGNIGVFEFLTVLALEQLGLPQNETLLGFALLFHLVVVGPVIVWGGWLLGQLEWPREVFRSGRAMIGLRGPHQVEDS